MLLDDVTVEDIERELGVTVRVVEDGYDLFDAMTGTEPGGGNII